MVLGRSGLIHEWPLYLSLMVLCHIMSYVFDTWVYGYIGNVCLFVLNSSFGEYDVLKVFDSFGVNGFKCFIY